MSTSLIFLSACINGEFFDSIESFKSALLDLNCPYTLHPNGFFYGLDGSFLRCRSWNFAGVSYSAYIEFE